MTTTDILFILLNMKKNVKIEILIVLLAFFLFTALYSQNDHTSPEEINVSSNNIIFGHDLFNNDLSKSGFSTVFYPDRYTLGPGDKLGIFLSGKIQEDFSVLVNVEGKIHVPTVGVLDVNGKTLKDLQIFLIQKLSKFYDNFHVDVMLIEPKTVQVSVVGEVTRPGKYVLTAMNTVIDALNMAGGPLRGGSLRDVRLIRDGKLEESVDFYEFLLDPKHADISFLGSGDRIYVPLMQAKVHVSGELKRNRIFELKPGARERLSDIVMLAGGFTDYAYLKKIEISRVEESGERRVSYMDYQNILLDLDHASNIHMKNDDNIKVYSRLEQLNERFVHIHGEVKRPGSYPLEEDLRLSDLILKSGNLKRNAYMLEAEIAKIDPKKPTTFIKIDLQRLLENKDAEYDVMLEEDDRVFIREIPEWEVGPTVEVNGEVMFPGTYSITKDSTKLSEVLRKTGG
ncbi:SLBB domain-containing protein, partial [bacterium]|nr:SLBB domain-containing protein [candidate division CSSED10-310 bacterium]